MVLDDIFGHRDGDNTDRSAVLPTVPCNKEKIRKGVRVIIYRTFFDVGICEIWQADKGILGFQFPVSMLFLL